MFRENGLTYWLQSDTRDAIIRAFDGAGRVVWRASYDSFGVAHIENEMVPQPWRLSGQYHDLETGLHYNFARYYSPLIKSYLSLDINWFKHGATNYSYAGNDPWNRTDPFGAFWHILFGAVVGAVIGGLVALATGQDPIAGALDGAIVGAALAIEGPFLLVGAAVVAAGFVASVATQALRGDEICFTCALAHGGRLLLEYLGGRALLGLLGLVGSRLGGAATNVAEQALSSVESNVVRNSLTAAERGMVNEVEGQLSNVLQRAVQNVDQGVAQGRWAERLAQTSINDGKYAMY
jgi:RHS repeat-associated protein